MRAKRVDANHAEIVEAFRKLGCSVRSTATVGNGFPDLAVAYRGVVKLVEVKDGLKPPSAQKLTPDEQAFFDERVWGPHIVRDLDDVASTVRVLREWHRRLTA